MQNYKMDNSERTRLLSLPRYQAGETAILGRKTFFTDAASAVSTFDSVFEEEVYCFESDSSSPLIIDGGANIGLSVFYFKTLFPNSRIIAFEPDPMLFKTLSKNVEVWNLQNVLFFDKALWSEETEIEFWHEGADGGRAIDIPDVRKAIKVKTSILSKYLETKVDFLKLDIEGSEYEVLAESEKKLKNAERIYIEYHSFKDKPQKLGEILSILQKNSFRYSIREHGATSRQPFIQRREYLGVDLLLHIFAYKESR